MYRHYMLFLLAVFLFECPFFATLSIAEETLLWPAGHQANGTDAESGDESQERIVVRRNPSIVTMLPKKQNASGAGVVICAGGGYSILAFEKEALEVGKWMNDRGIAAFCLKYRCGGSPNEHPAPLNDVLRAMRLVRHRAAEWNVEPDKIGVMGFSAGGHLAACASTLSDTGDPQANDPLDRLSSRPAFSLLIYPVITMQDDAVHQGSMRNLLGESPSSADLEHLSADLQVTPQTPTAFLVHATDDRGVQVENSLRYYRALVAQNVPAELHVFAAGGHGFGMRPTGKPVDVWPGLAEKWLQNRGLTK
jgi:acetyl esterase/lipase